jgi:hypothetical protein
MPQSALAEELVGALHRDPLVRNRVGSRVLQVGEKTKTSLPNIVVAVDGLDTSLGVLVTCRARTSAEADRVGAAVMKALSARSLPNSKRWVRTQDKIGYDSATKTFRRIISVKPGDPSK